MTVGDGPPAALTLGEPLASAAREDGGVGVDDAAVPPDLPRPASGTFRSSVARDLTASLSPVPPNSPRHVFLPSTAAEQFRLVTEGLAATARGRDVDIRAAYSIKTNPRRELLTLARASGMHAEVISQPELQHALAAGFRPGEIVLNGPGKWWPRRLTQAPVGAVFCDSLTELRATRQRLETGERLSRIVGVRLRPSVQPSRFGVLAGREDVFSEVCAEILRLPTHVVFGVHFHLPLRTAGVARWRSACAEVLGTAARLERATGRPVECLDIGGGWGPDDFLRVLLPGLGGLVSVALHALPGLTRVLLEPGRALAEATMAVLTQVLEVRDFESASREVVVDAAVSDLPAIREHPHGVLRRDAEGVWRRLASGDGRILGRTCMESDVLAEGVACGHLREGDILAITDAGAYDWSKSFTFAC